MPSGLRRASLLLPLIALALTARAQAPQPLPQISGRVVRADNGAPIPGATIYIEPPFYSGIYQMQTATTDSNGNYNFPTVRDGAGTYGISAYADGFVPTHYQRDESPESASQKIDSSTHLRGIDFRLGVEAVIRGTVVDPDGHPVLKGVTVNAVRRGKLFGGADGFLTATYALTDADGHFAIKQLPPGTYYVVVNGPNRVEQSPRKIYYQETWYGNKPSADGATQITLQQGEAKEGVEITARPENHYKVFVWPTGPEGDVKPYQYYFSLLHRNYTAATGQRDGSYMIADMSPGHYTMVSTVQSRGGGKIGRGQADFDVTDADVTLHINAGGVGEIQGSVNWKGTPGAAPVLIVVDELGAGGPKIDIGTDGKFSTPNVLPGKYVFILYQPPPGITLQSAQCNGVAVTPSTPLQVGDKQTITGCVLTLSSQ